MTPLKTGNKVVGHCPLCGGTATAGAVEGAMHVVIRCQRKDMATSCPLVAVLRDRGHDPVMQS
jgi:hypothetical protein